MRILWVKAGKLLPVDTGGKIRSFNLLRQLAARHDLVLLSYYGDARDLDYERAIREHFPRAETVNTAVSSASIRHYAAHLASPVPYAVTKFASRRVRETVTNWLNDGRFDIAVCDFLSASLNFPRRFVTPCVLFQHNVESVLWRRQAAHEPNVLKRMAFTMEAWKMGRYERATVARFPHVIAVSDRDRDAMADMTDPSRLSVVPTGVDVAQYRGVAGEDAGRPHVMFLGSMDWDANVDAVEHFCRAIWPAVRRAVPAARFRIVGRHPHPRVVKLASESVEVTGTVPSVIDYLRDAAVVVVPLRVGGGTRLKIFEAMAAGRAVVSTSIGAEGLDVADGRDLVLADDDARFAEAVIDLLRDGDQRRALGHAAAESAARYDWPAIALRFEQILRRAMQASAPVAGAARTVEIGA
ncbi:MAG TPA: glycosyltransferase family 4 protein [Vicinamibacterales bacterium]|jgi:glycosyltransferase involved in cell wall biosynthesis|nr:glycosyltransferase family 4 protein [Vicinamibacterales bacterium]